MPGAPGPWATKYAGLPRAARAGVRVSNARPFTLVWVNANVFGYEATLSIDRWGGAAAEGLVLFGVFWPVVSVGP